MQRNSSNRTEVGKGKNVPYSIRAQRPGGLMETLRFGSCASSCS